MMYGCGKSDEAIVAGKPANKAERSPAELVERRAEAKGNVGQQRTLWTQCQAARVTGAGPHTHHRLRDGASEPEVGAVCGKAARTDLCGGRGAILVPTATGAKPIMARGCFRSIHPTLAHPSCRAAASLSAWSDSTAGSSLKLAGGLSGTPAWRGMTWTCRWNTTCPPAGSENCCTVTPSAPNTVMPARATFWTTFITWARSSGATSRMLRAGVLGITSVCPGVRGMMSRNAKA